MNNKITITVAGRTAIGKTTTIALLVEQLVQLGCVVTVQDVDGPNFRDKAQHARSILKDVEIEIVEVVTAKECS